MIDTENHSYIRNVECKDTAELIALISYDGEIYKLLSKGYIFRGHSSDKYKLIPLALRDNLPLKWSVPKDNNDEKMFYATLMEFPQIMTESQILYDFYKMCDENGLYIPEMKRFRESYMYNFDAWLFLKEEEWIPESFYEIAALAQHYGLPTRLLDWTHDFYVALYFATVSVLKNSCEVEKLSRSEWVEEIENRMDLDLRKHKRGGKFVEEEECMEFWALDPGMMIANKLFDSPLQFVTPRYFENANLSAQKGILSYWRIKKPMIKDEEGLKPYFKQLCNKEPLDKLITDYLASKNVAPYPYLYHVTVPKKCAGELYGYLKNMHYDAAHLFPGYDGVVKGINENLWLKNFCIKNRGFILSLQNSSLLELNWTSYEQK